jgi:hypothetical protein
MTTTKAGPETITRRAALQRVGALFGGAALVGGTALLEGCANYNPGSAPDLFSAADIGLLDEIAETILPATASPGAKAAGTGRFIAVMVNDTYDPAEQAIFLTGLESLRADCLSIHRAAFMDISPQQRLRMVRNLDREQYNYSNDMGDMAPPHYFRMLKELTLLGYFTSEIGYTQAMRYIETPGRFNPCVPLNPGDKIWASHA